MECLTLALGHPAQPGEYRVFNQFADVHTVADLASRVQRVAREFDLSVDVRPVENPRAEKEQHFYRPDHEHLFNLGYRPKLDFDGDLRIMFRDLIRFRDRITRLRDVLMPDIRWRGARRRSEYLEEASAGLRPEK